MASISGGSRRGTLAVGAAALAIAFAAVLWIASSARAAELVYWDNYEENTVAFSELTGSGGGPLNLTGAALETTEGMAIDTVTGRIYVASETGPTKGQIVFLNLDGSGAGVLPTPGAPLDAPEGVALDPVTRMIYWVNTGTVDSIGYAKLDGSGGGALNTAGATFEQPYRLGLDPVAGRVYWANTKGATDTISFANVNNTGGGNLSTAGATTPTGITGFAVDPAAGRVYFLDDPKISYANTNGSGGGDVPLAPGAVFSDPYGLSFDPTIGRFYWGNYGNAGDRANAIGVADLNGGFGGGISIVSAPVKGPQDPTILKSPTGTGAPAITRSASSRTSLACSTGSWAADYAGSYVYQAPTKFAYQWTRGGAPIAGAVASTFEATTAGTYGCVVTASNQAGSGSQTTSAGMAVKAAKFKLSTKKKAKVGPGGTATFKIKATNQGDLKSKGSTKVCAKLPKNATKSKALKAPKCKKLGAVKGGGKKSATLKIKVGKSAAGKYNVKFTVQGSAAKVAKAKIIVK